MSLRIVTGYLGLSLLLAWGAAAQPHPPVQSLLVRARAAGLDAEQIGLVTQRASQAGLDAVQTDALLEPVVQLAEHDLPTHKVLLKALEGLAKQISPARIAAVLDTLARHTERAGRIVDAWLEQPEARRLIGLSVAETRKGVPRSVRFKIIESLTQATMQGLSEADMQAFLSRMAREVHRRDGSGADVSTAIQVLHDLAAPATHLNVVADLMIVALNAGVSETNLRQFPAALREARQHSRRPATELMTLAASALSQGEPATRVLNHLRSGTLPE